MAEFTPRAIALGALFGILFGAATVYLALRAGLTVSASVPIAVLSIAVFKRLGRRVGGGGRRIHGAGAALPRLRRQLFQLPDDLRAVGGRRHSWGAVHDP